MELYSEKTINEIKRNHGFRNSKSLGQNFLAEKEIIDSIIDAADISGDDFVVEIGPGFGVLTAEAAAKAAKVCAIELDERLIPILGKLQKSYPNIEVINNDVLKVDIDKLISERGFEKAKIIGNLPYYITTPIIMSLLENRVAAESITIMMQKEVAERIVSPPGSRIYGALSVAVQYYCEVETVVDVPSTCFVPQPKVDSAVLKLIPRENPPVSLIDEGMFFKCVKAGFGMRRKTLLNSLQGAGFPKDDVIFVLEKAGIDSKRRAETLSLDEFASLSNGFSSISER